MELVGAFHFYHNTQAFGTPITQLIPPLEGFKIRLGDLVYTPAGTAHDIIIMRALALTQTTAAVAAAATTINVLDADFVDQTIAADDYIVSENADGTYSLHLVSAIATLALTVGAVPKAINDDANIWIMGAPGDTTWHSTLKTIASTRMTFSAPVAGLAETGFIDGSYDRDGKGDPMLIYSANGTAAGTLNYGSAGYVRR